MTERIVDLSQPLGAEMPVFPGDVPMEVTILSSTSDSPAGHHALNSSRVAFGLHCGTHLDAPFHFSEAGERIDEVPLERCVGPAVLLDCTRFPPRGQILTPHLSGHHLAIRETGKVVLHTGWDRRWGDPVYFRDFPVLSGEASQFLVDCGVHLVGIDTPSLDLPPYASHSILLNNGVLVLENLTNLAAIGGEVFHLVACPLKITGREASPVRAYAVLE